MPGTITTMGYDALLRPTRIKSQAINALNAGGQVTTIGSNQTPAGNVLMDYRYTFNEVAMFGLSFADVADFVKTVAVVHQHVADRCLVAADGGDLSTGVECVDGLTLDAGRAQQCVVAHGGDGAGAV